MILYLVTVLCVMWLMLYIMKRRRITQLAAAIPDSKYQLPGIGIAHKLIGTTEDMMTSLQGLSYEAMNEGAIKAWIGPNLYFVMTNPVDLQFVLKTCLEKDDLYRFFRNVIGNNSLFAAPVPIWRIRRKILVLAFAPRNVDNFAEVFSQQSNTLVKSLQSKAGQGSLNFWSFLSNYSLNSVNATVMGVKLDKQSNSYSQFLESMNIMTNLVCKRISHLWLQPDWLFRLFPLYKTHEEHKKHLNEFIDQVIQKKRLAMKSVKDTTLERGSDEYIKTFYERKSFLDLLIVLSAQYFNDEIGYTDVELREEVMTLTVAGTDTATSALEFTLMLLAKYPEVQEKVYEELLDVFGDSERPPVKDDLLKLKYLERVVKESLRLYPPVSFIIRKVLEDTKLPSGRILPAGSGVVVSIWGVHRDPKYWGPDAECFDPDRFLPERYKPIHACSYMPFSSGPRNCVGYQYAHMSMKTTISSIVRRFKIIGEPEKSKVPHIRVKLDVNLKVVDGCHLALERRERMSVAGNFA